MKEIDRAIDRLSTKKSFECGKGATQAQIAFAEKALKINFCNEYRYFLETRGSLFWFGSSIFGISEDNELSTVFETFDARNESLPADFSSVPFHSNVLETYGGGGHFILFSKESDRAGEVSLITDETYRGEVQKWPTFTSFLEYWI